MAAYQVAPYIGAAVRSVLDQTYPAHEIVVCDDGSTDDLAGALAPFGSAVRVIRQSNRGAAAARNTAVAACSGDYVVVLDPDDRFLPERLRRLAELAARRPDLDVLTTDALVEFEGSIIGRYYTDTNRFVVSDQRLGILQANFVFGLAAVRRTALLDVGGYAEDAVHEDWDLWMRMILHGSRIGLVVEPLAVYQLRPGSLSSARRRLLQGRVEILTAALARSDLSDAERRAASEAFAFAMRMLEIADAHAAVVGGGSDARRRLLAMIGEPGVKPRTRLKVAAATVAPKTAARYLTRRSERRRHDPDAARAERE